MEYIQCTHCGKRYEVSDQIRDAAGQFTTCRSCDEKFLVVIHSGKKHTPEQDDSTVSTGGWDPSLTMPENTPKAATKEVSVEEYLDEDAGDGTEVLLELQAQRKKKNVLYAGAGLVVVALLAGVWFLLQDTNKNQGNIISKQPVKKVTLSAQAQDASNPECRQAAALQWLLDTKIMHTNYTGEAFVRMLKSSAQQTAKIHKVCKSPNLIQDIIAAATKQEKPDWFKAEIEVIQDSRKQ